MANISQKITPFLWFDKEAEEAAKFYTSVFKDSSLTAQHIMAMVRLYQKVQY